MTGDEIQIAVQHGLLAIDSRYELHTSNGGYLDAKITRHLYGVDSVPVGVMAEIRGYSNDGGEALTTMYVPRSTIIAIGVA